MPGQKKKGNKDAGKKSKTVGNVIDEDTEWIIATSKKIFEEDKDHSLWRKTQEEIAELFLVDHQMRIFKAEQVIKKVKEYFKVE